MDFYKNKASARLTFALVLVVWSAQFHALAQNAQEWTQQDKTSLDYQIKQIAALQTYVGGIKKGYKIASAGLGWINKQKTSDFEEHQHYFASLGHAGFAVLADARIPEVVNSVRATAFLVSALEKLLGSSFSPDEIRYANEVKVQMTRLAEELLFSLALVAGTGNFKDDERLKRLANLSTASRDQCEFMSNLFAQVHGLAAARRHEQCELGGLAKLSGISLK